MNRNLLDSPQKLYRICSVVTSRDLGSHLCQGTTASDAGFSSDWWMCQWDSLVKLVPLRMTRTFLLQEKNDLLHFRGKLGSPTKCNPRYSLKTWIQNLHHHVHPSQKSSTYARNIWKPWLSLNLLHLRISTKFCHLNSLKSWMSWWKNMGKQLNILLQAGVLATVLSDDIHLHRNRAWACRLPWPFVALAGPCVRAASGHLWGMSVAYSI
jgi:hypothetical protein